jgi:hypothetical protein
VLHTKEWFRAALTRALLVIGRSRIRRVEIDELVVTRLHITESVTTPSGPPVDNIGPTKQQSRRPKEWANLFDSRECARSSGQAILACVRPFHTEVKQHIPAHAIAGITTSADSNSWHERE